MASGGTYNLFDYTPSAFKHDGSGFYNFGQDNLPTVDLERRDDFLFYRTGAPTSSVDGITFVLSGTAGADGTNVYATIDDIVERLPKVVRFPVLIELCSYGDLGTLELKGIVTEGSGSIEFVNRNFSASDTGISYTVATANLYGSQTHTVASNFANAGLHNAISLVSSTKLEQNCFTSSAYDTHHRAVIVRKPAGTAAAAIDFVTISVGDGTAFFNGASANLNLYDETVDPSISAYDPNPGTRMGRGGSLIGANSNRVALAALDNTLNAHYYGNYFSKVVVDNCGGDIKFTGICVDTASGTGATLEHLENYGWDIRHSYITIENCVGMRAKKAGFHFENSKVDVGRSIYALRNYSASNTDRLHTDTDLELSKFSLSGSYGAGLEAINSIVNIIGVETLPNGGFARLAFGNTVGFRLINSRLYGGVHHTAQTTTKLTYLTSLYNRIGFLLENSHLDFNGRLETFGNDAHGVEAINSTIKLHQFSVEDNQKSGFLLKKSHLVYGKNLKPVTTAVGGRAQFSVTNNGQNFTLKNNSSLVPAYPESNDLADTNAVSGFGSWTVSSTSHGSNHELKSWNGSFSEIYGEGSIPGNLISDGSYAEFMGFDYAAPSASVGDPKVPVYGQAILAENNSCVVLRGLSVDAAKQCVITAAHLYNTGAADTYASAIEASWFKSAVCARNGSQIVLSGPNKISRYGVGLLAENNSTIRIQPPAYEYGDGKLIDGKSFFRTDLSGTHTSLNLHSTRAGIVLNNNSNLEIVNVGATGFAGDTWGSSSFGEITDVSGGYINFYANPFSYQVTGSTAPLLTGLAGISQSEKGMSPNLAFGGLSLGGMCVRAINNSNIYLNGVNFGAASANTLADNTSVSGEFYDVSNTCCRLMMWNIADSSKIHAANLLVSGVSPSSAGYHGPSGHWANGSSLDAYGSNGASSTAAFKNLGYFRLFFSVDDLIEGAGIGVDTDGGDLKQIISQGYSPSSSPCTLLTGFPTVRGEVDSMIVSTSADVSAYTGRGIGKLLHFFDESAGAAFANALHCTQQVIGLVSLYSSDATKNTADSYEHASTHGVGIKSLTKFDLTRAL